MSRRRAWRAALAALALIVGGCDLGGTIATIARDLDVERDLEATDQPPVTMALVPVAAAPGALVGVVGQHFGDTATGGEVWFGPLAVTPAAWSGRLIVLRVPPLPASDYAVAVTVGGVAAAALTASVLAPSGDEFGCGDEGCRFECQLDDGPFRFCPSRFSVGVSDGGHTMTVRAVDLYGNRDASPATTTWTVDTVAPAMIDVVAPAGSVSAATSEFVVFCLDPDCAMTCALDDADLVSCGAVERLDDETVASLVVGPLADGPHELLVAGADRAGNAATLNLPWTIDTVTPDTTIDSGPADPTSNATASFTLSCDEADCTFECALDGGVYEACPAALTLPLDDEESVGVTAFGLSGDLGDGSHTLRVRAIDAAGNRDATPAAHTWTIDTTPPDTLLLSVVPALNAADPLALNFVCTALSCTYECALDGAPFAGCSSPWSIDTIALGAHTAEIRAIDAVGNRDATPASATWTQVLGPETFIDAGPQLTIFDTVANFQFSSDVSDATFECALDGGAYEACTAVYATPPLVDGLHDLSVRAVSDNAVPDPTPATALWTVATGDPAAQFTLAPSDGGLVFAAAVTFEFVVDETGADAECSLDGGAFVACSSPDTLVLSEGPHSYRVRGVDIESNVGPADEVTFTVSLTPPPNPLVVDFLSQVTAMVYDRAVNAPHQRGFGRRVLLTADFSGDGKPELIVGNPRFKRGARRYGYGPYVAYGNCDDPYGNYNYGCFGYDGRVAVFSVAETETIEFWTANTHFTDQGSLGESLAVIGDVDGDQVPDIAAGAPNWGGEGKVVLLSGGQNGAVIRVIDAPAPASAGAFGAQVAPAGDINGDGVPDLLVSDPERRGLGGVYRFGMIYGFDGATGALIFQVGGQAHNVGELGRALIQIGDVRGGPERDWFAAGYDDYGFGSDRGYAFVGYGSESGGVTNYGLDRLNQFGYGYHNTFGKSARWIPDVTGDGVGDVVVGDPQYGYGCCNPSSGVGGLMLFDPTTTTAAGPFQKVGPFYGVSDEVDFYGLGHDMALAPDLTHDGRAELWASNINSCNGYTQECVAALDIQAGRVHQVLRDPDLDNGNGFGASITSADVDQDGALDLAVGTPASAQPKVVLYRAAKAQLSYSPATAVTFKVTSPAAVASQAYRLDAGSWVGFAGEALHLSGLSEGMHQLEVRAVSAETGLTSPTIDAAWGVDLTPPDVQITSPLPGTMPVAFTTPTDLFVAGTFSDPLSAGVGNVVAGLEWTLEVALDVGTMYWDGGGFGGETPIWHFRPATDPGLWLLKLPEQPPALCYDGRVLVRTVDGAYNRSATDALDYTVSGLCGGLQ